jgi:zinc protease
LIIVGDIKADTLLPTIKQLFEPIPRGPEPKPLATVEAEQKGERRFLLKREAQVPFVMMGYRVPNYSSEDSYALDILESILQRGKSSRLYQSLVYDQKSALAVGAEYSLMQTDPGLFYLYALVSPTQKVEAVEEALNKEIKRLQTDPPTDQELQRAKNQVEAARVFEQDSNFRHAMLLGQAETVGAGWRKVDQFLDRIRAVTAKDVQRVARQYLVDDNRTVGSLIPLPGRSAEVPSAALHQGKP